MSIYENVKENIKIAIFSLQDNILDEVVDKITKKFFNVEIYDDSVKLKKDIEKNNINIAVICDFNEKIVNEYSNISNKENIIFLKCKENEEYAENKEIYNIVDIKNLTREINRISNNIVQQEKIMFQNFKLNTVSNLVDTISHQVQANLLYIGASLDVIKMLAEDKDINNNKEKKGILENLYEKNSLSLQKANMLLELMSDATNISSESIMKSDNIIDVINLILEENIKENNINLNISQKLKDNSYICGPLNDIIFIICRIVKDMIINKEENITLDISEDESNWYFKIETVNKFKNRKNLSEINKNILYLSGVNCILSSDKVIIEINKIR